ncbi:MAG: BamA/TamA family outer membrane protein [Candidatus Babeliales bacterium]
MYNFLFFFLFFFSSLQASDQAGCKDPFNEIGDFVCSIDGLSDLFRRDIDQCLPDEIFVQSIKYCIDTRCDFDELASVSGLKSHAVMTKKDIAVALFYLKQMGTFKDINLKIYRKDATSYHFELYLVKHFTLSRLNVSGLLHGKDRYKNAYLIDIGDHFDQQKHYHSIEAMRKIFHELGYFHAQLVDNVVKHEKEACVSVDIYLKKGPRFSVDKVTFKVDGAARITQLETEKIYQKITNVCCDKIRLKSYSQSLVKNMCSKIKILLENQGFMVLDIGVQEKLHMDKKAVDVEFVITIDRKKEFVFVGNSFYNHQQLLDHLLLYGKSAWHFPSSVISDEIVQLYKSKGFWTVRVSVREEKDKVFCIINEGSRILISSAYLKNNGNSSAASLIKAAYFQPLKAKFFDKEVVKKTLEQLVKIYRQAGYWDAKIVKEDYIKGKKDHTRDLVLTIDEGRKRVMGDANIPGYPDIEQQFLLVWLCQYHKGFDSSLLLEQKQWLTRHLRNKGFLKVSVSYVLHNCILDDDQCVVDVTWNISLQESEVKFGKTIILGNSTVPYTSIMREVCYEPGENWDKQKIEQTLKNLRALHIFESVQIYPSKDVDEFLCKPIFMKLIHADRYEIRTRFGMQQVGRNLQLSRGFTYKLGGSLCVKNLFNIADQCTLAVDVTKFYRNTTACYEFPWLFERRIRCQFKMYDSFYEQPVYIGSKNSLYGATQQGFLWNMTHAFSAFTVSGSTGLEFMGIKQADQPCLGSIIDYDPELLGKKPAYIFFEPNIVWQKLDAVMNPRSGHLSFISCKGMFDLDTKTSFCKLLVEHSQYFSFFDKAVLALRLRGGHVFNRCFNQIIPIERFYLGGQSSIRGYERDYCPPFGLLTEPIYDQHAGLPACANNIWRYAPQGGRTMFNINTEVRFGIYKNLGGAIFNDMGALFKYSVSDELRSGPDNFFAGSGFGLRYETPIGPLRFDVAFKWKRTCPDFESLCVWYLTLGQAF